MKNFKANISDNGWVNVLFVDGDDIKALRISPKEVVKNYYRVLISQVCDCEAKKGKRHLKTCPAFSYQNKIK